MKTYKVMIALAVSALMAACNYNSNVVFSYENSDGYSVGDATIEQPVDEIKVNWYNGSITICYADCDKIRIYEECDQPLSDTMVMRHHVDADGDLDIQFCKRGSYKHGRLAQLDKRLIIEVPHGMTFDEIEINTVNGNIKIDSVLSRDLSINTVNTVLEAFYPVLPDEIDVNSVNDNVTLSVPSVAGLTLEMQSVNADFTCDLPSRKEGKKTIVGDGRCDMEFNTVNGSLTIKEL